MRLNNSEQTKVCRVSTMWAYVVIVLNFGSSATGSAFIGPLLTTALPLSVGYLAAVEREQNWISSIEWKARVHTVCSFSKNWLLLSTFPRFVKTQNHLITWSLQPAKEVNSERAESAPNNFLQIKLNIILQFIYSSPRNVSRPVLFSKILYSAASGHAV
jgi:hypothetical protein